MIQLRLAVQPTERTRIPTFSQCVLWVDSSILGTLSIRGPVIVGVLRGGPWWSLQQGGAFRAPPPCLIGSLPEAFTLQPAPFTTSYSRHEHIVGLQPIAFFAEAKEQLPSSMPSSG